MGEGLVAQELQSLEDIPLKTKKERQEKQAQSYARLFLTQNLDNGSQKCSMHQLSLPTRQALTYLGVVVA